MNAASIRRWLPLLVVGCCAAAMLWAPDLLACPVCEDVRDKNRGAYYGTALLLTFVPLTSVGAFVWVLVRRARAIAAAEAAIAPPAE